MFRFRLPSIAALLSVIAALVAPSPACVAFQTPDPDGIAFFEQKIRPVLVQHCYSCHSQEALAANSLKAGLHLDTAAGIAAGGESGPIIFPGKSADSPLLKAIRYDGLEMPPAGKLPDEVAADFARWIDMGAPDPRGGEAPRPARREIDLNAGRQWWSFRPLQQPVPPDLQKPIDSFIRAGWQQQGLTPAEPAAKHTLIRRALAGSYRHTPVTRKGCGVSGGFVTRCIRQSRRRTPCQSCLRRTLGPTLARCRPVRRKWRL
jgi:hypothetical protein